MTSVIIDMVSRGSVEAPLRVSESLEVIDLITSQFIFYNKREKYTGLLLLLILLRAEMLSLVFQLQSECVIPILIVKNFRILILISAFAKEHSIVIFKTRISNFDSYLTIPHIIFFSPKTHKEPSTDPLVAI